MEPVRQVREAEQVVWVGESRCLQQSGEKWWNGQAFYTAGLMRRQVCRHGGLLRRSGAGLLATPTQKRRAGEDRKRQRKGNTVQHWRIKQATVVTDTTDCREKNTIHGEKNENCIVDIY